MMKLRFGRAGAALLMTLMVAACGGGGGSDPDAGGGPDRITQAAPATRADAARFLSQASFGPTDGSIERVMSLGYARWIDEQLAMAPSSHRAAWDEADAAVKAINAGSSAGQNEVLDAFWRHAVNAPDQLRQRMAFALSQIFVISMQDGNVGGSPRAVAAWMDMLATDGLGNYRGLLEQVSRHPMMGRYLTHLGNRRADPRTGRVPDENYAREVMQLFSIGLVELGPDGRPVLDGSGAPRETYTSDDISGLAKVFTGWSWACPGWPADSCFTRGSFENQSDPDRAFKPMLGYPQFHSPEAKTFLGLTIPAQDPPDPEASLAAALDHLAAHPNVGPFIGRQLIQRLVTSNPSPAYVAAVARAFADNGAGVRGDMKAVLKAVLLHPEARRAGGDADGKLREPVLRLAAYLRAFPHTSDTGRWRVGNTDNPASALGQSPLRSPSVFNFYRPGYVAPGTLSASAGLVAPELQIAHETSVAGYVNYVRSGVESGVGQYNGTVGAQTFNRRDLQRDWRTELALADDPAALVTHVLERLVPGQLSPALHDEIVGAIAAITVPALNASGSNQRQIDDARRNRVRSAVLLALVSPEFLVQR